MRRASATFQPRRCAPGALGPGAMALGFGRTATTTTLGQRLDFIAQRGARRRRDGDARVRRGAGHGGRQPGSRRATSASRSKTRAIPASASIRVTTALAIDEPVVTIDLTVGCGSQMSRRFVAFVDPPSLQLAERATGVAPHRSECDPQVAPLLDIVGRADASRARIASAGRQRAPRRRRSIRAAAHVAPRLADACRLPRLAVDGVARPRPASARKAVRPEAGGARDPCRWPAPRHACASTPRPRSPPHRHRASAPLRRLPEQRSNAVARWRADAIDTADAAAEASPRRLRPRSKPHRRRSAQERARIRELEAGLRGCAAIRRRSSRRWRRCRRACARPSGDATATCSSTSLAPRRCSSRCSRPRSGRLRPRQRRRARWFDAQASQQARAAAAAAVDLGRRHRSRRRCRGRRLTQRSRRRSRRRSLRVSACDGSGSHRADDAAVVDRRPRGDDGARRRVALRAHGRGRRRRMRRGERRARRELDDGRADRPRAAGRVLRRPRPGRGGDRAARRPTSTARQEPVAVPAAARDPPAPRRPRRVRGRARGASTSASTPTRPTGTSICIAAASSRTIRRRWRWLQALWPTPLHGDADARSPAVPPRGGRRHVRLPGLPRAALPVLDRARARRPTSRPTSARSTCSCRSRTRRSSASARARTATSRSTSTSRGWPDDAAMSDLLGRSAAWPAGAARLIA